MNSKMLVVTICLEINEHAELEGYQGDTSDGLNKLS